MTCTSVAHELDISSEDGTSEKTIEAKRGAYMRSSNASDNLRHTPGLTSSRCTGI